MVDMLLLLSGEKWYVASEHTEHLTKTYELRSRRKIEICSAAQD